MCACLDIARSTYYYKSKNKPSDDEALEEKIQEIFRANRCTYGTRRIKKELSNQGKVVSRRKIKRIMKKLSLKAFHTVKAPLSSIQLFHTDRGSEFDNQLISELLDAFDIVRSLSAKGCPYDNAVAEATFKTIKTEFVYQETFGTITELQIKWFDYVHWYNHIRLHSTLDYMTPIEFRLQTAETTTK